MTDTELIRGIAAKDREAVNCLVETYQERIVKTAYYFLHDLEEAQDIAQEVFIEILDSIGKFRQASSLSTWIYRITVNRSINAARKNKRRQLMVRLEHGFGSGRQVRNEPADKEAGMTEEEAQKLLRTLVSGLSENQRKVFILHKFEELSYKEIAEVTGWSLSSVESLLHRARLKLQQKMAGHFSSPVKK